MEGHTPGRRASAITRGCFPEIYRATVSAGEQSGHLDEVLERLADYTENRESAAPEGAGRHALPHRADGDVFHASSRSCWSTWCRRSSTCSTATAPSCRSCHARADRRQRLPARSGASGWWSAIAVLVWLCMRQLKNPAVRSRFGSLPAATADRRPDRARLQHRALHPHLEHPDRQLRAGAGSAAHRRRGGDQPADARGGCHGNRRACAKARRSAARWASAGCSRP